MGPTLRLARRGVLGRPLAGFLDWKPSPPWAVSSQLVAAFVIGAAASFFNGSTMAAMSAIAHSTVLNDGEDRDWPGPVARSLNTTMRIVEDAVNKAFFVTFGNVECRQNFVEEFVDLSARALKACGQDPSTPQRFSTVAKNYQWHVDNQGWPSLSASALSRALTAAGCGKLHPNKSSNYPFKRFSCRSVLFVFPEAPS